MKILVTGCAGFIGFHLCNLLLKEKNILIYGVDNLNSYYSVEYKKKRLEILRKNKRFHKELNIYLDNNFISKSNSVLIKNNNAVLVNFTENTADFSFKIDNQKY